MRGAHGTAAYAIANIAVRVWFGDHGARVMFRAEGRTKECVTVAYLTTEGGLKLCMLCGAMSALAGLLGRA